MTDVFGSGRLTVQCSQVDGCRVPPLHMKSLSGPRSSASLSSSSSPTRPLLPNADSSRNKLWMGDVWPRYHWEVCPPQLVVTTQLEPSLAENQDLLTLPDSGEFFRLNSPSSKHYPTSAIASNDNVPNDKVANISVKTCGNHSDTSQSSSIDLEISPAADQNRTRNHDRKQDHNHHHFQRQVLHGNGGVCIDGVRWPGSTTNRSPRLVHSVSASSSCCTAKDAPAFVDRLWRAFGGSFDDDMKISAHDPGFVRKNYNDVENHEFRSVARDLISPLSKDSTTTPSSSSVHLNQLDIFRKHHARHRTLLNKSGWYYGRLSRQAAYGCLAATQPGTYLVRDSSTTTTAFALSVQTIYGPTSVRLHVTCDDRVRLEDPESLPPSLAHEQLSASSSTSAGDFNSVAGLVDYYSRCGQLLLPVCGPGVRKRLMALRLTAPLLRKPQSLKHLCRLAFHRMVTPQSGLIQANTPVLSASIRRSSREPTQIDHMDVISEYSRKLGLPQELLDYVEDYPCPC